MGALSESFLTGLDAVSEIGQFGGKEEVTEDVRWLRTGNTEMLDSSEVKEKTGRSVVLTRDRTFQVTYVCDLVLGADDPVLRVFTELDVVIVFKRLPGGERERERKQTATSNTTEK